MIFSMFICSHSLQPRILFAIDCITSLLVDVDRCLTMILCDCNSGLSIVYHAKQKSTAMNHLLYSTRLPTSLQLVHPVSFFLAVFLFLRSALLHLPTIFNHSLPLLSSSNSLFFLSEESLKLPFYLPCYPLPPPFFRCHLFSLWNSSSICDTDKLFRNIFPINNIQNSVKLVRFFAIESAEWHSVNASLAFAIY